MRFIEKYIELLTKKFLQLGSQIDISNPEKYKKQMEKLASLNEPALPGQVDATIAMWHSLEKNGFGILSGEMGVGKTNMGFYCAELIEKKEGKKILFLTDGSKHYKKMAKKAESIFGKKAKIVVIRNWKQAGLMVDHEVKPGELRIYIVSKDTAKLGYPMAIPKFKRCPDCGADFGIRLEDGKEIKENEIKNGKCSKCGSVLFSPRVTNICEGDGVFLKKPVHSYPGIRRMPIFLYIRKYAKKKGLKKVFDLAIVDEAHNMQNGASLQSQAFRDIVKLSRRTLAMTGTLANGYASSLFYILYALMPKKMKERGYELNGTGLQLFIDHYGARKRIYSDVKEKGKKSSSLGKSMGTQKVSELPVISRTLYANLLSFCSAYKKIEDLNYPMPPYKEMVEVVDIEPAIEDAIERTKRIAIQRIRELEIKRRAGFLQAMLYIPNNPAKRYIIKAKEKKDEHLLAIMEPVFDESYITKKERRLIELIKKEAAEGRRVMVYTLYNTTAEIKSRLYRVLSEELDLKIGELPDKISAEKIEQWIEENPLDVFIVPFYRVATGLDIPQYPTIVFYDMGYDIRKIQQAARRSWRAVVQKNEVRVYFLVYSGFQATALELVSKKIAAAGVVEGRVADSNSIDAFTADSMELQLMNALVNKIEEVAKPDFATTEIPAGRARPWTKWEQFYIDRVKELNPHKLGQIAPEQFEENPQPEERPKKSSIFDFVEEEQNTETSFDFSASKVYILKKTKRGKIVEVEFEGDFEKAKEEERVGIQLTLF